MASNAAVSCPIFLLIFTCSSAIAAAAAATNQTMVPMECTSIKKCDASLYHVNGGVQARNEIAAAYSVNPSQVQPIERGGVRDYLITAACSCESAEGVLGTAYFHDTSFRVRTGDSLSDVSNQNYSGQMWIAGDPVLVPGNDFGVKLLCGCVEDESKIVVTYTVQSHNTLSQIASLFWTDASEVFNLNRELIDDPEVIDPNWVLFVPMPKTAYQNTKGSAKKHVWTIVVAILATLTVLSLGTLLIIFIRRKLQKSNKKNELESSKPPSKNSSMFASSSLQFPFSRAKSESHKRSFRKGNKKTGR